MAATGFTPISLYYSTTASAVPSAGNLANGELALNTADMKLYAKNSSGTVTLLASNAATVGVDSLSFGSTGLTPNTATTGAITVGGTLNVANGGTGLTSLTAGYIPFGNGTSALGNSVNLFWDSANARLGVGTNSPTTVLHTVGANATLATTLADSVTYSKLRFQAASGSSLSLFQGTTGSTPAWYFQIANGGGTSSYDISLNPFGGNVGIGLTTPTARLEVKGAGNTTGKTLRLTDSVGNETFAMIDGGGGYLNFGGFGVGTTTNPGVGGIYATGNITAYYSSDIKFKENVRDIPDALATVNAIGGKLFDWTDEYIESKGGADGYFVQKADFGVVAQDVQKVFPIAVRTRPDGSLAVDYEKLGALAFAALVELTKRVEALEAK